MEPLRQYREIWLVDFEFRQPDGERPTPVCMAAQELRTGRKIRKWGDRLAVMPGPPFSVGADALFAAFFASAELGCFLALSWQMPARILDLFCEFRTLTNGRDTVAGNGLLGALAHFGLASVDAAEKSEMQELAQRSGPHTPAERHALLDYCATDVTALARLLPAMLPHIDLPRALLRGRYMAAVATMERNGVPIDVKSLNSLRSQWGRVQDDLVERIDASFGVYVSTARGIDSQSTDSAALGASLVAWAEQKNVGAGVEAALTATGRAIGETSCIVQRLEQEGQDAEIPLAQLTITNPDSSILTPGTELDKSAETMQEFGQWAFSARRFAEWLVRHGIPWPQLESGALALDEKTFRQMARIHPTVAPLRELRHSLGKMRLFSELAVGSDGRNRCLLSPFRSVTGRNQPSNARFIFGPSCWLRSLIRPEPACAVAYVDWAQQEFGIAAALSGDAAMMNAYSSGDPYLTFAKQARAVPCDATKQSHPWERGQFKVCALGVQYGMGPQSLARSLNQPIAMARELLQLHRQTYPKYWEWSEAAVNHAMLRGWLQTAFGWRVQVGPRANPRSLANFAMQANGAEMLRLACCLTTERGIRVCAPIHDALLIEAEVDVIEQVVADCQAAMREASEIVLNGFSLRSDAMIVRHPDRYTDPRGVEMWRAVWEILDKLQSEQVADRRDDVYEFPSAKPVAPRTVSQCAGAEYPALSCFT